MARGYRFDDSDVEAHGPPSRPARRSDSRRDVNGYARGEYNYGYTNERTESSRTVEIQREGRKPAHYNGGHYAESPILMPEGSEKNLSIVRSSSDHELRRGHAYPGDKFPVSRSASNELRGYHEDRGGNYGPPRGKLPISRTASDGPLNAGTMEPPRRSRSTTLNRNQRNHYGGSRSSSRPRPPGSYREGPTTVSKVTRSKSLSSRPAGVAVHHPAHHSRPNSHIYPVQAVSRPGTRMSSKSGMTSGPHNSTKAGVVVETMSAPNPFCPNTRGVCCLMVLINLALILVAIGFIIVLQLPEPAIVWNIGVVILVFGFFTFFVSLLYCMCICQDAARNGQHRQGELYWTHHWQKNITIPEIKTSGESQRWAEQDRFPEDESDTSSSRDYPRLYLESEYATEREADFETDKEADRRVSNRYNDRDHYQPGKERH